MKKDKVVFTETKKDLYLGTWLKYYSRFFDDIYIISTDPDVPDDILEEAHKVFKFTVIKDYSNPSWNMGIDCSQMKHFQKVLLEKYKWVLFTHVDEFIIPDPKKYKNLSDYINKCKADYVYCSGYNILQMYQERKQEDGKREEDTERPNESALDLSCPILKQRKYWWYEMGYNKPLLSRIPLNWSEGFHKIEEVEDPSLETLRDPDLILCHLKQADYNIFGKRIAGQFSTPAGYPTKDYEWFYKGHDRKELIPERFKGVF